MLLWQTPEQLVIWQQPSQLTVRSAAESAAARKETKYIEVSMGYRFFPITSLSIESHDLLSN